MGTTTRRQRVRFLMDRHPTRKVGILRKQTSMGYSRHAASTVGQLRTYNSDSNYGRYGTHDLTGTYGSPSSRNAAVQQLKHKRLA